jgi:DNA-directed RNA polymerase subunit RPC12/RpoP
MGLIRRRQSALDEGGPSGKSSVATARCPACGAATAGLRARMPLWARLDPLARAIAGRGLVRCPECGHRWAADDIP